MLEHLREFFGIESTPAEAEYRRELVKQGSRAAAGHGIVSEQGVCFYVDLAMAFGSDFDRSPRCGWAKAVLADTGVKSEQQRLEMLRAEAQAHEKDAVRAPKGSSE